MDNSHMKASRFLRWHEARRKLSRIIQHLEAGGKVLVATHYRSWQYTAAHIGNFRATQDGLLCRQGKQWNRIDYCAIRFLAL